MIKNLFIGHTGYINYTSDSLGGQLSNTLKDDNSTVSLLIKSVIAINADHVNDCLVCRLIKKRVKYPSLFEKKLSKNNRERAILHK